MEQPRYPDITVKLIGTDGNIFSLVGAVRRALLKANVPQTEISEFIDAIMDCDCYDEALCIILQTVEVE